MPVSLQDVYKRQSCAAVARDTLPVSTPMAISLTDIVDASKRWAVELALAAVPSTVITAAYAADTADAAL